MHRRGRRRCLTFSAALWISCVTLLATAAQNAAAQQQTGATRRLRVMTYNIHHGEGTDRAIDLERIAAVIRAAQPDLVALQEVDCRTQRTGEVDQTAELARLTEMHGVFARQIPYEGGEYGQALLSRFPLSDLKIHWLPGEPERERRIAAAVRVDFGQAPLLFVSTHLHHRSEEFRQRQAETLNSLFTDSEVPVILAGDLNALPDSRVLNILRSEWQDATAGGPDRLTFPAENPQRQIDFVLARPGNRWIAKESRVVEEPLASDHRPLLVEYELAASPAE